MVKAVIIDDEVKSRESIREMLRLYCPDIMVVAEADSVKSALTVVEQFKPDLVFLDIKMSDGSGFDFLSKVQPVNFNVIFVTAYEQYAIKAFKFNAIDYITKPIDPFELKQATEKALKFSDKGNVNESIKLLLESIYKPPIQQHRKMVLRTLNTVHIIEIDRLIRCESDRNYTKFFLIDGEKLLMSRSLKEYEETLLEHGFLRVHNSHLINVNFVKKFIKDDLILVLTDNTNIPVSFRKREELLDVIKSL